MGCGLKRLTDVVQVQEQQYIVYNCGTEITLKDKETYEIFTECKTSESLSLPSSVITLLQNVKAF